MTNAGIFSITVTKKVVKRPNKSNNVTKNTNEVIQNELYTKKSRLRNSDFADDVFEDAKTAKTVQSRTEVDDLQRKSSFTLLKKYLLEANPFEIFRGC